MAALPQHQQQQQRPWWQQSPCAIVHGLQRGLHENLQRAAAAAPWAQQQPQPQPQPQQQPQQQQHSPAASNLSAAAATGGAARAQRATSSGLKKAAAATSSAASAADGPVTREELGRSTWVFLHTLAAQFPARPTRQQQRDARAVLDALTRIYPCGDCARHFGDIVRADPPDVSSGAALQRWMCRAHNVVNARLGKPTFNCDLASARWAPLDCGDGDHGSTCDLAVGSSAVAAQPRRRW